MDQVHVLSGDGWRGWNRMVRHRVFNSKNSRTPWRWRRSGEIGVFEQLTWSDERSLNNWLSSRTIWGPMKGMRKYHQMRGIKPIDQVHVRSGDGYRGWEGMIRRGIFKQLIRFTYVLEMDKGDGKGRSDEVYSNNWPSSRTFLRRMKMRWDDLKQLT